MSGGGAAGSILVLFFGSLVCAYLVYRYTKERRLTINLNTLKPPKDLKHPLWRNLRGDVDKGLRYLLNHRDKYTNNALLVDENRKFNSIDEFVEACYTLSNANFAYFQISMFVVSCIQLILCGVVTSGWLAVTVFAIVWVLRAFACFLAVYPIYPVFRVSRLYGVSNIFSLIAVIIAIVDYVSSDIENLGAFIVFVVCAAMSKIFWLWTTITPQAQNVQYTNMFLTLGSYTASASATTVFLPISEFVEGVAGSAPEYVPPEYIPGPPPSHESGSPARYSYPQQNPPPATAYPSPQHALLHASYPPPPSPLPLSPSPLPLSPAPSEHYAPASPSHHYPSPSHYFPPSSHTPNAHYSYPPQHSSSPPPSHVPYSKSPPVSPSHTPSSRPRGPPPNFPAPAPPHSRPPSIDYVPPDARFSQPPPPSLPTSPLSHTRPPSIDYAPPSPLPLDSLVSSPLGSPHARPPSLDYDPPLNSSSSSEVRPPSIDLDPPSSPPPASLSSSNPFEEEKESLGNPFD